MQEMNSWPFCSLNNTPDGATACADLVLQTKSSASSRYCCTLHIMVLSHGRAANSLKRARGALTHGAR